MRRRDISTNYYSKDISIHASHAGCDTTTSSRSSRQSLFQSTHPMRDATRLTQSIQRAWLFQSTHPMRDATLSQSLGLKPGGKISIHASHAGCDTKQIAGNTDHLGISIHASHAGCDDTASRVTCKPSLISIHASHAGCDFDTSSCTFSPKIFQSTHPMRDATRSHA